MTSRRSVGESSKETLLEVIAILVGKSDIMEKGSMLSANKDRRVRR